MINASVGGRFLKATKVCHPFGKLLVKGRIVVMRRVRVTVRVPAEAAALCLANDRTVQRLVRGEVAS